LNGEDLRGLLVERKARLKKLLGRKKSRILFVDHIERRGRALFEKAWIRIKNPAYSQAKGRQEFFECFMQ
jgi:hypothetical protein